MVVRVTILRTSFAGRCGNLIMVVTLEVLMLDEEA